MLIRLMHIMAIAALLGSAGYAYSIKYESIYYAEKVSKLKAQIQREKDAIAASRADWQFHVRPDRLEVLTAAHLDLKPLEMKQIVSFSDIPARQPRVDEIGRTLEALGLSAPTATPGAGAQARANAPTRVSSTATP